MKKLTAISLALFIVLSSVCASAAAQVAALMYHEVTTDESRHDDWGISPEQLEADINYFLEHGYVSITAGELANESMENLDGKKILLLTFDDGYVGWYTDVYPILQRTGAKATMFVVGAYINRYGYLSEDQIREMANCGLIEIGNHTNRVHQMPKESLMALYNSANVRDVLDDISSNSAKISRITGKSVTSISWPYGYTTAWLSEHVRSELGYTMAFDTTPDVHYYNGDTSIVFNRINREYYRTPEDLYGFVESLF